MITKELAAKYHLETEKEVYAAELTIATAECLTDFCSAREKMLQEVSHKQPVQFGPNLKVPNMDALQLCDICLPILRKIGCLPNSPAGDVIDLYSYSLLSPEEYEKTKLFWRSPERQTEASLVAWRLEHYISVLGQKLDL